jgi:hypothetical protein
MHNISDIFITHHNIILYDLMRYKLIPRDHPIWRQMNNIFTHTVT